MNKYEFILNYIHSMEQAIKNGYNVSKDKQKVLRYKNYFNSRSQSKGETIEDKAVEKAAERLYNLLYINADYSNIKDYIFQDKKILEYWGVQESPIKALGNLKGSDHLIGFTACFTDKFSDKARQEPVRFNSDITESEALILVKKQFDGIYYPPDGLQLINKIYRTRKFYKYRQTDYVCFIDKNK